MKSLGFQWLLDRRRKVKVILLCLEADRWSQELKNVRGETVIRETYRTFCGTIDPRLKEKDCQRLDADRLWVCIQAGLHLSKLYTVHRLQWVSFNKLLRFSFILLNRKFSSLKLNIDWFCEEIRLRKYILYWNISKQHKPKEVCTALDCFFLIFRPYY